MATDASGRLLVGISGQRCALCRLEGGELKTIFEPNDANYIFAISVDKGGDIYLGTGPKGKIYRLDSSGKRGEVIYDSPDKNILSLAQGPDGFIYAGSDSRGLIYRINPKTKEAAILYDSEQQEITALVFWARNCTRRLRRPTRLGPRRNLPRRRRRRVVLNRRKRKGMRRGFGRATS